MAAPISIVAEDDSFLKRSDSASQVNGLLPVIEVKDDTAVNPNDRLGFLDFNLSTIIGEVTAAQIDLQVTSALAGTYRLDAVLDGNTNENIIESTFSKATTGLEDNSDDFLINSLVSFVADSTITSSSTSISFSSTELINLLNDDTNDVITLVLRRVGTPNAGVAAFASRNQTVRATLTLTVTTAVVPEPASVASIGAGRCACSGVVDDLSDHLAPSRGTA